MDREELEKQKLLTYKQLVEYLLSKYGAATCNYFCRDNFKSKNRNVSRSDEGLICHHIDEDKAIMLSTPQWAEKCPYEWQKADRLVYCNYLEHLLLHIKIAEEPRHPDAMEHQLPGIGGAVNFIIPELNDYFGGYTYTQKWRLLAFEKVDENYDEYIQLLEYLWSVIQAKDEYRHRYSMEKLSSGYAGTPYKMILKALKMHDKELGKLLRKKQKAEKN